MPTIGSRAGAGDWERGGGGGGGGEELQDKREDNLYVQDVIEWYRM